MTDDAWTAWVEYHAEACRWTADADLRMLGAWRPAFEARGCTVAELRAATLDLIQRDPRWRSEHLNAILAHVAASRMHAMVAARAAENARLGLDHHRCPLCHNCGMATVPHPKRITDGEWVYPFYTAAVTCSCQLGARIAADHASKVGRWHELPHAKRGKVPLARMMDLPEYETLNPDWQPQMVDRERRRAAEQVARDEAAHGDRTRGPLAGIVKKLLAGA